MRFLLTEDHHLVRTGLKHLLAREFPSAQIGEAADAAAAMAALPTAAWDLILLDLELPDRSGLDLIRDIRTLSPHSRILVVSGEDETEVGNRVFQAGAHGFITKTSPNADLVTAIRRVLSGKKYVSPDLAANLIENRERPRHDDLSDRELEVLKQFGRGLTVSQIASNLGLSVKTVSTYRARIVQKLGLETTGDIVRYAIKANLA